MLNGESKRFKRDKNNKIAAFFDIAVQFKINKKIRSLILKISSFTIDYLRGDAYSPISSLILHKMGN